MNKLIILISIFAMIGCGTVHNLSRPAKAEKNPLHMGTHPTMEYYGGTAMSSEIGPLAIFDFPMSLAFDTLTLPVVYFAKMRAENAEEEKKQAKAGANTSNTKK
ncbi:YceK/YidQ family lipoprotein [Candidatus Uabimicrobium sp. HlEnr_7]|uniref:YceK/YidQ family lipoprotein n=1 Tax=Candidatus Uabimicrobium helgolandensis TaxID=3095367 RepID=UPI003557ACB6